MIKSAYTALALATVLGTQRLIVLTLPTVAKLDIDASLSHVALNRCLIFTAIKFGQDTSIDLSRHGVHRLQRLIVLHRLFGYILTIFLEKLNRHVDVTIIILIGEH